MAANVLPVALRDTLILMIGVGALVSLIGTSTAWLVTAYEFPGRRALSWALLLPLSVPTYIIAYAYLDILHPIGPVQTALRAVLGIDSPRNFRLPDIRSMTGCILLLGFVLYPYVYLTTRAMFQTQAAGLIEAARVLGTRKSSLFFRVALPLAHPAIAIGVSLALMEALNDIGASEFLGVRTLSVSIYTTWVTRSDLPGAAQIALVMLIVVVLLVMAERWARRHRRYAASSKRSHPLKRVALRGMAAGGALIVCTVPILIGFLAPALYLLVESVKRIRFGGVSSAILRELANTITVSLAATIMVIILGLVVAYAARLGRGGFLSLAAVRLASLGYAIPGTVLAIGILPLITGVDTILDDALHTIARRAIPPLDTGFRHGIGDGLYGSLPGNFCRWDRGWIYARILIPRRCFADSRKICRFDALACPSSADQAGNLGRGIAGFRRRHEGTARHVAAPAAEL